VTAFEDAMAGELAALLRAGVPARAVRIAVRERVVARMERGPLGAREVADAVESAVRAACRLARELQAPDELVEIVCRAALEAVRGHGGHSAIWLDQATLAADAVLGDWSRQGVTQPEATLGRRGAPRTEWMRPR
jgi:hypothetical protein